MTNITCISRQGFKIEEEPHKRALGPSRESITVLNNCTGRQKVPASENKVNCRIPKDIVAVETLGVDRLENSSGKYFPGVFEAPSRKIEAHQ